MTSDPKSSALPTDLEVMHPDNDSLDGEEELIYPVEASDVFNPSEVKTIWDKLNEITPLEAWQQWPSKVTRKNLVNRGNGNDNCII